MFDITMTENQKSWMKELLSAEISEALSGAKCWHLAALGSDTQEESVQCEQYADEQRGYAKIIRSIMSELGLNEE